ncbi:response regulator transcription factor [Tautonia plasticadhaerens]|uniref:HTH-type transcriptional regulator n=1 Tax=Tautonia plasticadhaerens TaxID=2527974 RepID=A0A518H5T6_9BACT|nr:LuxR C-terminal-related transcriptional regulator [Tautonia plasticadhaerens]QDV36203.1 Putative HTH-type transcriptional regulator [Tautonia plasticadhaerens]
MARAALKGDPVGAKSRDGRVGSSPATEGTNADDELVSLIVKELIGRSADRRPEATLRHLDGELLVVLLDVEVNGVRCLLVQAPPEPPRAVLVLSPRECEIARMVAKGYPNKTIAAVLEISSWTVGTHLRRIFAKLGVCSRAAMVARLAEEGLIRESAAHVEGFSPRWG